MYFCPSNQPTNTMLIIGIAGGTGSGKTTVVRKIVESLPANAVAVIPQDSYYKHQWDVPEERRTIHVEPRDVIIVEGIMALYDRDLREQMDLKIFVDTCPDERLLRVIERDIAERGHPLEMLIEKYRNVLKPMHDEFIEPSKQHADIILPNGGDNSRAIAMMQQYIRSAFRRNQLAEAFGE